MWNWIKSQFRKGYKYNSITYKNLELDVTKLTNNKDKKKERKKGLSTFFFLYVIMLILM